MVATKSKELNIISDIQILKGPLSKDYLQAITYLYSPYNQNYSSTEYCRTVFNDNPQGFSYHIFAYWNSSPIGHYSLIPLKMLLNGKKIQGVKGEAFIIHKDFRSHSAKWIDQTTKLAFVLLRALNEYVEKQGVDLSIMVANKQVGQLHKIVGAKEINCKEGSYRFFFPLEKNRLSSKNRFLKYSLSQLQSIPRKFWNLVYRRSELRELDIELESIKTDNMKNQTLWEMNLSQKMLKWTKNRGVKFYSLEKGNTNHLLVCHIDLQSASMELFLLNYSSSKFFKYLKPIVHLLQFAEQNKLNQVTFSPHSKTPISMKIILLLLGFLPRKITRTYYIRGESSNEILEKTSKSSPFFYLGF